MSNYLHSYYLVFYSQQIYFYMNTIILIGICISLFPLKSGRQNRISCPRDMCGNLFKVKMKGNRESQGSLQTVMQVCHLWKGKKGEVKGRVS